jgi:N-acetylglutamate synthase-like GNAT family acetyltransferase
VFVAYDASSEEAETEKLPENSEIVGFVALRILDGLEFVAKIAVRQQYQKLGIGSSLIKRAEAEVLSSQKTPSLTLTTFRDVPWNGKWYAKFGFRELSREGITELGPQHVALFEKSKHAHETAGWAWIMMSKRLEM